MRIHFRKKKQNDTLIDTRPAAGNVPTAKPMDRSPGKASVDVEYVHCRTFVPRTIRIYPLLRRGLHTSVLNFVVMSHLFHQVNLTEARLLVFLRCSPM